MDFSPVNSVVAKMAELFVVVSALHLLTDVKTVLRTNLDPVWGPENRAKSGIASFLKVRPAGARLCPVCDASHALRPKNCDMDAGPSQWSMKKVALFPAKPHT
jgi:hypothetical protein